METTNTRLVFYERMKKNAQEQNADQAFGFWCGAIQAEKAAQHRMHWTALWVGLGSFVLGFATCAIILALL